MTDSLLVYDEKGVLCLIVHDAANSSDPAWNMSGGVTISIPRSEYDVIPPPKNFDGVATYQDLNKTVVSKVSKANQNIGLLLQANIDAIDTRIIQIADNERIAKIKWDTFYDSLDVEQKTFIDIGDHVSFIKSLKPNQITLAPDDIKQQTEIISEVDSLRI